MKVRPKVLFFAVYCFALLASHLWQAAAHKGGEAGPVFVSSSDRSKEAPVLLVFEGAGGASEAMRESVSKLQARIPVRLVRIPFQEQETSQLLADWKRQVGAGNKVTVWGIAEGYGAVGLLEFLNASDLSAEGILFLEPILSTRFELLGDERLNGALKAFQLVWFWVFENAIPHFGYLDHLPYNYDATRRIYGLDQTKAAALYERLDTSILLVGRRGGVFQGYGLDAYQGVQPAAQTVLWNRWDAASASQVVERFINANEGEPRQISAEKEARVPLSAFPNARLEDWWAATLLAVATFASEDFACIGGGLLAANQSVGLGAAILGCVLGIFVGDFAIYLIGRIFGRAALDLPVLKHLVSGKALRNGADWFERKGLLLVVLTRFFPGSRVPTYFAAGVVGVGSLRFGFALLIASMIWTPLLVLASFFLGNSFLELFESMGVGGWFGIVGVILCFAVGVRFVASAITWKGRRLLYSKWRRLRGWEFWPMWAVYFPVVFKILWLAIRYRSVSLPFSVNPCMLASGLVYESKIQILKHLERSGVPIARFEVIEQELDVEAKRRRLEGFFERIGIRFPVVLKPDIGQRGEGVTIARSWEEVEAFFASQGEDAIAQEYVEGREYGVFYHRFHGSERGSVSSITDKRLTSVVGDGKSTLERLILADDRAVCMARFFLKEHAEALQTVVAAGERYRLARIGNHCRGAIFLDGAELITPALSEAVDAFSRSVEGFHFGRYDLRVPSEEALRRGEGIKVIELNGITSEPTNMYDPKHGPLFGWRSLMQLWELIFALAKENRLAGHGPVSKRLVIRLAIGFWRGVPSKSLSL